MVTRRGALDESLPGNKSIDVQQIPRSLFSGFSIDSLTENKIDMPDVKSMLLSNAKHMTDCLQRVSGGLFPRDRGT